MAKIFIGALNIFSVLALVIFLKKCSDRERNQLRLESYCFRSGKIKRAHCFLFLTDVHEKEFGEKNEELLRRIRALRPDFILLGGDLVVCHKRRSERDRVRKSVRLLRALGREFPVYLALGNHEERLFEKAGWRGRYFRAEYPRREHAKSREKAALFERGLGAVRLLDKETVLPEGELSDLSLSGVSLPMEYYRPLPFRKKKPLSPAELRRAAGFPEDGAKGRYHIFLLHTPLYDEEAVRSGADLVLSGHLHGGTIRLPLIGGVMTPQYRLFVKKVSGLFPLRGGNLVISRGIGTHTVNIRLNNPPELSLITLLPEREEERGNGETAL